MNRLAHVQALRRQIEQRWGDHVLLDAGQSGGLSRSSQYAARHAVPTGFATLDRALGGDGLPRGRIVELLGSRTSGKTSLALRLISQVQRNGGLATYVDAARAFHPPSAGALGVLLPSLLLIRPHTTVQALEATASLLRDQIFEIIIYDLAAGNSVPDTSSLATLAMLASKADTLLVFLTLASPYGQHSSESGTKLMALDSFTTIRLHVQRFTTLLTTSVARGRSPRHERDMSRQPALPTEPFTSGRQRIDEKLIGFVHRADALEEDVREPVASASLTASVLDLVGTRISVTVVKNKLGASGMTLDLDISRQETSPSPARSAAMERKVREDEDCVYLGAGLPDLGREAALA